MKKYTLNENNSGGSWWLNHEDYLKLFEAGWKCDSTDTETFLNEPGDTTPHVWRRGTYLMANSHDEAVESFEKATGQDYHALGCECCGEPFYLSNYND